MIGEINPIGSNIELTMLSMPLLVSGIKTTLTAFSLNCCWLSNAVFLNAQFELSGESVFSKQMDAHFVCVSMSESFEKHHKNLNASLSTGRTWTW